MTPPIIPPGSAVGQQFFRREMDEQDCILAYALDRVARKNETLIITLVLRVCRGLSNAEVARVTRVSKGEVSKRQKKALVAVRNEIADYLRRHRPRQQPQQPSRGGRRVGVPRPPRPAAHGPESKSS